MKKKSTKTKKKLPAPNLEEKVKALTLELGKAGFHYVLGYSGPLPQANGTFRAYASQSGTRDKRMFLLLQLSSDLFQLIIKQEAALLAAQENK